MSEPATGRAEFSVVQFFPTDDYEKVVEWVHADRAMQVARQLVGSIGGRLGTTKRVIITDGGDCICFEWKFGEGVTFPPEPAAPGSQETPA